MNDINFEQYKVFYYVAKNASFSKASKELFISQSAVSQSIKNLEKRIGTPLFLRKSKTISLTTQGEVLHENVKIAFSYIKNGENLINNEEFLKKTEIKIAASDTISKYYLLPYIENFHKLYPNVKIKIINKYSAYGLELLKNSEVDIALINQANNTMDKTLSYEKVKKISDIFVAGPIFSHLKNKSITLKELENYPILALESSTSSRKNLDEVASNNDVNLTPEIEMQSMGLLKDLARIGLGISYISDLAVSKTSDLFTLKIKETLPSYHIAIVTQKHKKRNPNVENFLELIK